MWICIWWRILSTPRCCAQKGDLFVVFFMIWSTSNPFRKKTPLYVLRIFLRNVNYFLWPAWSFLPVYSFCAFHMSITIITREICLARSILHDQKNTHTLAKRLQWLSEAPMPSTLSVLSQFQVIWLVAFKKRPNSGHVHALHVWIWTPAVRLLCVCGMLRQWCDLWECTLAVWSRRNCIPYSYTRKQASNSPVSKKCSMPHMADPTYSTVPHSCT